MWFLVLVGMVAVVLGTFGVTVFAVTLIGGGLYVLPVRRWQPRLVGLSSIAAGVALLYLVWA